MFVSTGGERDKNRILGPEENFLFTVYERIHRRRSSSVSDRCSVLSKLNGLKVINVSLPTVTVQLVSTMYSQLITIVIFVLQQKQNFAQYLGTPSNPSLKYVMTPEHLSSGSKPTPEFSFPGHDSSSAQVSAASKSFNELQSLVVMNEGKNETVSAYKPPPPPTPRNDTSEGQCTFDPTQWRFEPQSAIANAVMFDRKSGISCEECLQNCMNHQDVNSLWVCRTLTYDNRWQICDLYAVIGTVYPQYLIVYPGRDYFQYLNALGPTTLEMMAAKMQEKKPLKKLPPIRASGFPIVPNPPMLSLGKKMLSSRRKIVAKGQTLETRIKIPLEKLRAEKLKPIIDVTETVPTEQPEFMPTIQSPSTTTTSSTSSSSSSSSTAIPSSSSSSSSPFTESCGEGEVTRYAIIQDVARTDPGTEILHVNTRNIEDCAKACDKDEAFTCISAVVSNTGCELSATPATHAIADEFRLAMQSHYIEKVCLQSALAANTELLWPIFPNRVLIGHVLEVTDAETLDDCLMACLRAQQNYNFLCRSGMWYPEDDEQIEDTLQNCLLNSESRHTASEAFAVEQPNVQMIYFDVPREDFNSTNSAHRYRDDPLENEADLKYTRWSKCNQKTSSLRIRYLKCSQHDIRKCPKETKPCGLPIKSLKHECIAVRDILGIKRCPHGLRQLPDGSKTYCKNPVDC